MRGILVGVVVVIACGGGGRGNGDDGDDDGSIPFDCAGLCGQNVDAKVKCDLCRFDVETALVGEDLGKPAIAFALGPTPQIAVADSKLSLLSRSSVWTSEDVGAAFSDQKFDLAVAPDGGTWILVTDSRSFTLDVFHKMGDTWVRDKVATVNAAAPRLGAVVVTSDGVASVVFAGTVSSMKGVYVSSYNGSTWSAPTLIAATSTTTADLSLDAVAVGNEIACAWLDPGAKTVTYAYRTAGTYTVEPVATAPKTLSPEEDVALAVDSAGRAHVVYRDGEDVYLADRDGTWTTQLVAARAEPSDIQLALDSSGNPTVAWQGFNGLWLAVTTGGVWLTQVVVPICSSNIGGHYAMQIDAADIVWIAHGCSSDASVHAWTVSIVTSAGTYPADYRGTCEAIADAVCTKACACGQGEECSVQNASSRAGFTTLSYNACYAVILREQCGDATQDPAKVYACHEVVGETTCNSDSPPEAVTPEACKAALL